MRVDILDERMRQALLTKTDKQVFLRGDGGVQLQDLMDVMDKLKAGGVEKVGIVAKLPGERHRADRGRIATARRADASNPMEAVTDILVSACARAAGLNRMVAVSLAAHAGGGAVRAAHAVGCVRYRWNRARS